MSAGVSRRAIDAYGKGGEAGHARALAWLANPNRGSSRVGGTLQGQVLELAKRMRKAKGGTERSYVKGEIVAFCYAIECPEHAELCRAAAAARRGRKGREA